MLLKVPPEKAVKRPRKRSEKSPVKWHQETINAITDMCPLGLCESTCIQRDNKTLEEKFS